MIVELLESFLPVSGIHWESWVGLGSNQGVSCRNIGQELGVADTAFFQKMNIFIEWIIRLFFEWMNSLNEYFWFSFEWINSLNEYFRRTIEWIIEWIRKVRYSYEKWTKSAFFGRNGPLLPVFHCFLKLWFVFQFEWIILLNEYFWLNLNE